MNNEIATAEKQVILSARPVIDELELFAQFHQEMLADVDATLCLAEEGFNLVYGLDFDIIFGYANPWSLSAYDSELITYFFDHNCTYFTLLPGTVEELFGFVTYADRQVINASRLKKELEDQHASNSSIKSALNLCREVTLEFDSSNFRSNDLSSICKGLVEAADRYSYAIGKIDDVISSTYHVNLQDLFPDSCERYFSKSTAQKLTSQFANFRPGPRNFHRNSADAKNLATVIEHAKFRGTGDSGSRPEFSCCILRLLTNTSSVARVSRGLLEYDNPLDDLGDTKVGILLREIEHSFAFRTCVEACYALAVERDCGQNVTMSRNVADIALSAIMDVKSVAFKLDRQERNVRFGGTVDDKDSMSEILHEMPPAINSIAGQEWFRTVRSLFLMQGREYANKSRRGIKKNFTDTNSKMDAYIPSVAPIAAKHLPVLNRTLPVSHEKAKGSARTRSSNSLPITGKENLLDHIVEIRPQTIGRNKQGRRVTYRNRLENIELLVADRFESEYQLCWPAALTETRLIKLLNKLLSPRHAYPWSLAGTKGQLFVVFPQSDSNHRIATLPLEGDFTIAEYDAEIDRILLQNSTQFLEDPVGDAGGGTPGFKYNEDLAAYWNSRTENSLQPSQIWLDMPDVNMRFDIYGRVEEDGILGSFLERDRIDVMEYLFAETSRFAGDQEYFTAVRELLFIDLRKRWK